MFFPERIISIKPGDKVLEIGPGGTPHPRSDVFLELLYDDPEYFKNQRGNVAELVTTKPVVFYDGSAFPFGDREFDYIICSHVLEHVPDVPFFLNELVRVGKKGYLEYPTIYYDYVYNFDVHLNFLMNKNGVINWMKKDETRLNDFSEVQYLFYQQLSAGSTNLVIENLHYFMQGFEWNDEIKYKKALSMLDVTYDRRHIKYEMPEVLDTTVTFKDKVKIKLKALVDKL
jgi:SAM-dependent methyltransferase